MEAFRPCVTYERRNETSLHARQALNFEPRGRMLMAGKDISVQLHLSYNKAFNMGIKTKSDYEAVATVAQDS
jgi:hypothetical protein